MGLHNIAGGLSVVSTLKQLHQTAPENSFRFLALPDLPRCSTGFSICSMDNPPTVLQINWLLHPGWSGIGQHLKAVLHAVVLRLLPQHEHSTRMGTVIKLLVIIFIWLQVHQCIPYSSPIADVNSVDVIVLKMTVMYVRGRPLIIWGCGVKQKIIRSLHKKKKKFTLGAFVKKMASI